MSLNHTRLRIVELEGTETFDTGGDEVIVLPLAGSCVVTIDGSRFELEGRESVFSAVTDFAYAPRDARVEVLTPGGNWSSYPPHRHDALEEIYYFEVARGGFAYQRVYDGMDLLEEVRTGDRIDMPCGYHGP